MKPIILTITTLCIFVFSNFVFAGYGSSLCSNSDRYYCYRVKRGDSWGRLFDNEQQRDLVMRINRINTHIYPGMIIAIPKDLDSDVDPLDYSPFKRQIEAPGTKVIMVSLGKLAFGAYDADGSLEYWGPVSGARGYCPDIHRGCHTPTGRFYIYQKEGPGCKSTKFPVGRGGAPMPYCMYFHGGFALHGSYEVPGYNASHGCVRMFVHDAEWLNEDFTASGHVSVIISY